jgi:hypothetical protein
VATKLVSLTELIVRTGILGGEIKVVIAVVSEGVEPVVFVPVITREYAVRLVKPLKVAEVPLTEGVVDIVVAPALSK